MDKNSITGIVLIMGMLLGYQYFFAPKEIPAVKAKAVVQKTMVAAPKDTASSGLIVLFGFLPVHSITF